MNTNLLQAAVICLFCAGSAFAQTSPVNQSNQNGKRNLVGIERVVLQGRINRCVVFYLPSSIETFNALNPGDVEHAFRYKLEISFLTSHSKLMTSLCQAIKETKVSPPVPYSGDFRWGCNLFDDIRKKVYSIFIDNTGRIVVVNGKRMYFQGGIDAWFKTNLSNRFESLGK